MGLSNVQCVSGREEEAIAFASPAGNAEGGTTATTTTASPLISVANLTRSYGPRAAVEGVSFELAPGVTGLLGPNGAGKSTLVRCLAGLSRWDEGEIRIAGIDPSRRARDARRHIGYMPERVSFPPEMRVGDYLRFAAEARGIPRRQRAAAVETALGQARLEHVAGRIVANLSKGYRQRVGLAQALLADPPILILDEPSAGLDPLNVIEMRDALRGYGQDRVVLVSTHILPETRLLCDRVLVMSQGRLVYDGSTAAMASGGSKFTVRVRAAGPQGGPPGVAMDDTTLIGCTAVGGDYDLVVDAPDDGSVGRFVARLHNAGWLVVRVEATGDTLEDAFRRAVLGAEVKQ